MIHVYGGNDMKRTQWNTGEITDQLEMENENKIPVIEESEKPVTRTGRVANAKNVRIRQFPSLDASVLGLLSNGELVSILNNEIPDFYKIESKSGIVGYVSSKYVEE